jgi:DNA polymerase-3 subunit delta'
MNFSGLYGNEPAKEMLRNLRAEGRFPQALILQGESGCGKRTFARRIAQALVCTGDGARPCGRCAACRKSMAGGHPDILFVDGGSKPRGFGVDLVRSVRTDVRIRPNEADRKVYILAQAHNMTEQAQNALLKILEEPPGYAVFLLTCESAQQLLSTVRSRCMTLTLSGVSAGDAMRACALLCPDAAPEQLEDACRLWNGNIGRMAASLADGEVTRAHALCGDLLTALTDPAETALLIAAAPLIKDKNLCRTVCTMLRGRFIAGMSGRQTLALTPAQCAGCCDAVTQALAAMDRYANQTLTVTLLCASMRRAFGK